MVCFYFQEEIHTLFLPFVVIRLSLGVDHMDRWDYQVQGRNKQKESKRDLKLPQRDTEQL